MFPSAQKLIGKRRKLYITCFFLVIRTLYLHFYLFVHILSIPDCKGSFTDTTVRYKVSVIWKDLQ